MPTKEQIIEILKTVYDPEVQVDVWTMGLIYDISIDDANHNSDEKEKRVNILMTLTTPTCPYGPMLLEDIRSKIRIKTGTDVEIRITFSPPWQPSPELRAMLGV